MSNDWSEDRMLNLIDATFPAPTYVVLRHVRNGTGYRRDPRTVDALVVGCWPSRGLVLWGFEVKVTRADFRREMAEAEKADAIARYCDAYYIAAPKSVVPLDEVPPAWGLYEAHGGKKLTCAKEAAPTLEPRAVDRLFLAAICRAATTNVVPKAAVNEMVEQRVAEHRAAMEKDVERGHAKMVDAHEYKMLEAERDRLKEGIEAFEAASGIRISHWDGARLGQAVVEALRYHHPGAVATWFETRARQAAELAETLHGQAKLIRAEAAPEPPTHADPT